MPCTAKLSLLLRVHNCSYPLLPARALNSPEYAAWTAHIQYFQCLIARRFSDASIARLAQLIYIAQSKFLQIKAYELLWKPKNHFAQHFPLDIKRFGPLRGYWCMRFEAKNQEHKRAAKMGRWVDVPKTVSDWWVHRSHLRLIRKRSSAALSPVASEEAQKRRRYIRHPNMEVGMWVQIERQGVRYIAQVVSLTPGEVLTVCAFSSADLRSAADGTYMDEATLSVPRPPTQVSLTDQHIVIVRLLVCRCEGKVRFVAQP